MITSPVYIFSSPIGPLAIACNDDDTAITELRFASADSEITSCEVYPPLVTKLRTELDEYFAGTRTAFDIPLQPATSSDFRRKVWQALLTIPYGETRSYADIARQVGSPKSCRAVGGANHCNPIAILIPCHRVIGAGGQLTGYAGGMDKKQYLLRLENRQ